MAFATNCLAGLIAGKGVTERSSTVQSCEVQPTPTPEPAKKGCGKSAAQLTVITMSVASLATLIIRKRK